jgi:hypothetical protein
MKVIGIRLFELTQVLKYFATLMEATNLAMGKAEMLRA